MMMPSNDKICEIQEPLNWNAEKNQLMLQACVEMATFHYTHSNEIKQLYEKAHFHPTDLKTIDDLAKIPTIGVTAMKHFLMTSLPEKEAVLKLTSSGTRGQKTQIWFDQRSLARVQKMLDVLLAQEGLISDCPTNYLVLNYDPADAKDLGVAYTEKNQLRFAPVKNCFYAIKKDSSEKWYFHKNEARELLRKYQRENHPVRIFAMPAFLFEFVEFLGAETFQFPEGSTIITGGGFKAQEDKSISREEFRALCAVKFGIKKSRIRDGYGMAEHSAPYFECEQHRFHVPVYNRLLIRNPQTFEVLPPGEKGLLELITPFNAMMPTLALLSTDWAMLDAAPCPCQKKSPTFTLLGRAGLAKHKGCALNAEEIVKRKGKSREQRREK